MKEENILLRPGTPDDDSRDYLPERLKEFNEALTLDGKDDVWDEWFC